MKNTTYMYYDWFGRLNEVSLKDDKALDKRCPRDGVRLICYNGDPHNVVACPLCDWKPSHYREYNQELDIQQIQEKIDGHQREIDELKAKLDVVSRKKHPIRLLNLKT